MTDTNTARRGWRATTLTASIVLNIFFIALIGGHVLRVHRNPALALTFAHALANAEAALPKQDAVAFSAVLHRDEPRYEDSLRQLAQARAELEKQLTTEPFDRQKVAQALLAWRNAWVHFTDEFGGPLVDALSQVSPEGRRQLVAQRRASQAGLRSP